MNNRLAQLLQHIEHADLNGIDGLEEEDMITGVVVMMRVERPDDVGASALVMSSDVDYFTQLGLIDEAHHLMRTPAD